MLVIEKFTSTITNLDIFFNYPRAFPVGIQTARQMSARRWSWLRAPARRGANDARSTWSVAAESEINYLLRTAPPRSVPSRPVRCSASSLRVPLALRRAHSVRCSVRVASYAARSLSCCLAAEVKWQCTASRWCTRCGNQSREGGGGGGGGRGGPRGERQRVAIAAAAAAANPRRGRWTGVWG